MCSRASTRTPGRPGLRPRRRHGAATVLPASSPASDSPSDCGAVAGGEDERHERAQHSVMKRQRRRCKDHFYNPRDAVPSTRGVSTVTILRRAVDLVRHLTAVNEALLAEHCRQRARRDRLMRRLSLLNGETRQTGKNN